MRMKAMMAGMVTVLAMSLLLPAPAGAFGWKRDDRTVHHHVYYPKYHHHYSRHSRVDPYAYRYEHRGYYPYYGSRYWRRAYKVGNRRFRYRQPRYYPSWGYYKRKWRRYHRGHRHRHHHW